MADALPARGSVLELCLLHRDRIRTRIKGALDLDQGASWGGGGNHCLKERVARGRSLVRIRELVRATQVGVDREEGEGGPNLVSHARLQDVFVAAARVVVHARL